MKKLLMLMVLSISLLFGLDPSITNFGYLQYRDEAKLMIFDTANPNKTKIVSGIVGDSVAIDPRANKVYATDHASNLIRILNPMTGAFTSTTIGLSGGIYPHYITLNGDGSKAYVSDASAHKVFIINTVTNTITNTIDTGTDATSIVLNPNGTKAYIGSNVSNILSVMDIATNNITTALMGNQPRNNVFTPDGTKAYMINTGNNTVSVINTATNTITATLNVGNAPVSIDITPDGSKVFVANVYSNSISVIN
jgi:YVTN family beta-propeller protein